MASEKSLGALFRYLRARARALSLRNNKYLRDQSINLSIYPHKYTSTILFVSSSRVLC